MPLISTVQLRAAMPHASQDNIAKFIQPINDTFDEFQIDTPIRQAMWLANVAVESGSLRYVREIADGSAYEGRADLGNTKPGDGMLFRGRGLAQCTGRSNYRLCGEALGIDLLAHPERLEEPVLAARSAGWFWRQKDLKTPADRWNFGMVVRAWNGGFNGWDQRLEHFKLALHALGGI